MKDSTLTGAGKPGNKDASGLRSANDMDDSVPEKGWGGVEEIPGVDSSGSVPMKSAADVGMGFGGPVGGMPISIGVDGDDVDVPLATLMNVGEEPGPNTGAGLRSAVDSVVKT